MIGWLITATTLLCIPAFGIFNICRAHGESVFEVSIIDRKLY